MTETMPCPTDEEIEQEELVARLDRLEQDYADLKKQINEIKKNAGK